MKTATLVAALSGLALLAPAAALADDTSLTLTPPPTATGPTVSMAPMVPSAVPPDGSGYVPPHFVPYVGGAIPSSAHLETKPDLTFVGAGIGIASLPYVISLAYALSTCGAQMDCRPGSAFLYAPVVGPFITAAQSPTTGGAALAAFDGGLQLLGAALVVVGFAKPNQFVVWQDHTASLAVTPTTVASGAGGGVAITLSNM